MGETLSDKHFIFYHELKSPDGSIIHLGDDLTGGGDGDAEQVNVDLTAVPTECRKIVFAVSIYGAEEQGITFGQIKNAAIRIVDQANGREIARYELAEVAATETAVIFGELYRRDNDWKFLAIGHGYASGLAGIARDFGVNV